MRHTATFNSQYMSCFNHFHSTRDVTFHARSCGCDAMTLSTNQDFHVTPPTPAFLRHELLNAIALKRHVLRSIAS
ncbi:MAG: hypothetical protein PV344_03030, partial [Anaplasma sp.]|nr:hypothetical protein [Anaplasma sp.]